MLSTQTLKQQLWQEIEQFSVQQLWELLQFIYYLKFKTSHPLPSEAITTSNPLTVAAQAMLADYTHNPELTAFIALDGVSFS